jgi:hypothetical protein
MRPGVGEARTGHMPTDPETRVCAGVTTRITHRRAAGADEWSRRHTHKCAKVRLTVVGDGVQLSRSVHCKQYHEPSAITVMPLS